MKQLYAPWRTNYTLSGESQRKSKKCIFCSQIAMSSDKKNLIIKRFSHCFVMLNLFPYNAGHLMAIPYQHTAQLVELSKDARAELMEVIALSMSILTKELKAEGFNAGFNLGGKPAGGSIPEHLHVHVLPRWLGDTNFLATLADVKPISLDLVKIYEQLDKAFAHITI
jgi:ATP adenylyltransferase